MRRQPLRVGLALVVMATAIPALAVVTEDDLREAEAEVGRILDEAHRLGDQVQEAWGRQAALEHEIAGLEESIAHARGQIAEVERRLETVAVEMYMTSASGAGLNILMTPDGYHAGLQYLSNVNGTDENLIGQLRVFRSEVERQTERLAVASAEQKTLAQELEEMAADLTAELAAAQVYYDRLVAQREVEEAARRAVEEAARRAAEEAARTTTTPTTTTTFTATTVVATTVGEDGTTTAEPPPAEEEPEPGGVCPVAGAVTFTDTWGAPRSGGRVHLGVDMIAARGTPVVAIFEGTVLRLTNSSLGGLSVWLRSGNGDRFYYAHLDSYGDVVTGQTVSVGEVLGYVGTTGNAPSWLPHLHFEYHPGGGAPVNPYPLVRSVC
ncbi:MAG: peptidoglycan DD-metalloendopeptidase family protein [Actinobacteria bacterium]|nr:peptidoglycan DD-metalloendopeptidase family protein [Actinomycetota bacterium]